MGAAGYGSSCVNLDKPLTFSEHLENGTNDTHLQNCWGWVGTWSGALVHANMMSVVIRAPGIKSISMPLSASTTQGRDSSHRIPGRWRFGFGLHTSSDRKLIPVKLGPLLAADLLWSSHLALSVWASSLESSSASGPPGAASLPLSCLVACSSEPRRTRMEEVAQAASPSPAPQRAF